MDSHTAREIRTFSGDSLAVALERSIRSLVASSAARSISGDSFLLGFTVEAPDISSAIMEAIEHISGLASEYVASVIDCEVSGIQETDEGHRIWGTIECTRSANGPPLQRVAPIGGITVEQTAPQVWRVTVLSAGQEAS
jgi:hypothetical protein